MASGAMAGAAVGLERFGEFTWHRARDSALVGIALVDPTGDTISLARLSGDEVSRGDGMINQVRPNSVLAEREALRVRLIVCAVDMRGTRAVP